MEGKIILKGSPKIWTNLEVIITIDRSIRQKFKLLMTTIFGCIILFGSNVFAQEKLVNTFSGSGGKNTRPFSVNESWEIQWDAKGDIFQLYLYSSDGSMLGVPANQQGAGKGSSYQSKGGEYYLQVNAIGNWTVKIIQISSINDVNKPTEQKKGSEENTVTFSGSGGKNTRPFNVSSGWEIQWDAKGDIFQLYLYDSDGSMLGVPANQQGAGKGSSYQAKGGQYYLQVNAIGNWTIKIVTVK